VYSLDEDFLPHPAIALILIFPTSDSYEAAKATDEALREHYSGSGPDEDVIWFKQTINNACGLYAILHAVCNGDAVRFIRIYRHFSCDRCIEKTDSKQNPKRSSEIY
jgi:ubiquitin carboxyl-terminal hydrolase L3